MERGRSVSKYIHLWPLPTDGRTEGPAMRMDTLAAAATASHASLTVGLTMTILCDFLISYALI